MSDRFFLDTNIFVYSFDQSAPQKARKAAQLIRDALTSQKGIVSFQVVQEFFNVALRRFSQPMQAADAALYLNTVFRPLLAVHSSQALYAEALFFHAQSGVSWFDSLIVSAAIQARCEVLFSEDFSTANDLVASRFAIHFFECTGSTPASSGISPSLTKKKGRQSFRPAAALSLGCLEGTAVLLNRLYCKSLVTSCCTWLACANAAMPVWLRISYFDMFEVAEA